MSRIYLVYFFGYLMFLSVYSQEDTSQPTNPTTNDVTPPIETLNSTESTPSTISTASETRTSSDTATLSSTSTTINSPTDSESLKDSETPNPSETTTANSLADQVDNTVQNINCKPNCAICQEKDSCDLCATGFGFNSDFECSK